MRHEEDCTAIHFNGPCTSAMESKKLMEAYGQAGQLMDEYEVRRWALDLAISQVPGGTPWTDIFPLASRFAGFVMTGQDPKAPKDDKDPKDPRKAETEK